MGPTDENMVDDFNHPTNALIDEGQDRVGGLGGGDRPFAQPEGSLERRIEGNTGRTDNDDRPEKEAGEYLGRTDLEEDASPGYVPTQDAP